MATLERKIEQEQLEFLEKSVGRVFPSFKYLTELLWGRGYIDTRMKDRDKKRLAEVVEIEYREDTWQVKIIKMKQAI